MEVSMFSGFNDMEMDDLSFIDHMLQVNSMEEIFEPSSLTILPAYDNNFQHDQTNEADHHIMNHKIPTKHPKITNNHWDNSYMIDHALNSQDDQDASNFNMLCFSNSSSCSNNNSIVAFPTEMELVSQAAIDQQGSIFKARRVANNSSTFASLSQQSKDHIIAERKRREKLNQRFRALTTIIPGLKKMDKASVLGDAFKYVKQLQEQVKKLEEETKMKTIESTVLVKRSKVISEEEDDDHHSSMEDDAIFDGTCTNPFPEIEVRFSNKDVFIRIHCEKKNGVIEELLSQIESLHLVVTNSSALVYGCVSLDATIIAQIGAEFNMTTKDLVRHLYAALKPLM